MTLLWDSVGPWDPNDSRVGNPWESGASARTTAEKILLRQAVVLESVGIQRFSDVKHVEAIWLRSSAMNWESARIFHVRSVFEVPKHQNETIRSCTLKVLNHPRVCRLSRYV